MSSQTLKLAKLSMVEISRRRDAVEVPLDFSAHLFDQYLHASICISLRETSKPISVSDNIVDVRRQVPSSLFPQPLQMWGLSAL